MKKFTLFLVSALLVAVTGLAIGQKGAKTQFKHASPQELAAKKAPLKQSLQKQNDLKRQMSARWSLMNAPKGKADVAQARKAVGDLVIENQPKGDYVSYVRSGEALFPYLGYYIVSTQFDGMAGDVVFGDNNTIYFKNLLSQYTAGTWTKGKIDGNTITIEFPQPVMKYDGEEYDLFLGTYDEENMFTSVKTATLTLDYNPETGDITTPEGSDFATGALQIGLCASDGSWAGYTDWNINMTKQTDVPVTAPEGLETAQYSLLADGYPGSLVNVGFDGNDVYVQGICSGIPDGWAKGTISGDKVTFKGGQYLGSDGSWHQYLVAATATQEYDEYYDDYYTNYGVSDGDIVFDYDASAKTLSNSSLFLVNAGTTETNYSAVFDKAVMAPFTEVATTPAAPEITAFEPYSYDDRNEYGWGFIEFNLNTKDVNGNYILPEKMSYKFYTRVGDEVTPVVFYADSYAELAEDMTEVPFGFTEGWDFYATGLSHSCYVYFTGYDALGVQTIYRGAGEEHASEIAWLETGKKQADKVTPEYPDVDPANTGSTVTYSLWDGKSDMNQIGESAPQTYDVAMKVQDEAVVGTHIDKISFVLMKTLGISDVKVWLSTNLRVEGGKAVANLVEVPVENPQAGFNVVTLEKPYTIPAEGVYVGYSFTVNDATIDANQAPIVIAPYDGEEGLWIHSSKMYVGWTDITSDVSGAAYLMVDVSGSSVKDDAAAPQAGETLYVKTGDAVNVTTQVVNHGSKGIASLDIDYTLNGTTTSKHYELVDPLGGFYGQSCEVSDELPAIAEAGNYDLKVKVAKVNGQDNQDVVVEATSAVVALNTVPKKRTLLEEYTGTWCGWCVRGFVGLEKLAELYPDEYVLIAYHNSDPMEIMPSDYFPSRVEGFPTSWMDRAVEIDPYYGSGAAPLSVVNDLSERNKTFGQADIQLTASLNEDNSAVVARSTTTFPYDNADSKYAIEYVLVANGLTGEGSDWEQSNYYSGENTGDANLAPFEQAESHVAGLKFNDVAVMMSEIGGIENSLPAAIKADETVSSNYTFYLDFALNTSFMPVIQDVNNLYVVALLVNQKTGEVANAIKTKVEAYDPTGIETVMKSGLSTVTERYNAAGQRITAPQKGLNIIKLSNGKTVKVMVK